MSLALDITIIVINIFHVGIVSTIVAVFLQKILALLIALTTVCEEEARGSTDASDRIALLFRSLIYSLQQLVPN